MVKALQLWGHSMRIVTGSPVPQSVSHLLCMSLHLEARISCLFDIRTSWGWGNLASPFSSYHNYIIRFYLITTATRDCFETKNTDVQAFRLMSALTPAVAAINHTSLLLLGCGRQNYLHQLFTPSYSFPLPSNFAAPLTSARILCSVQQVLTKHHR